MRGVEPRGTIAVRGKVLVKGIGNDRANGELTSQQFNEKLLSNPCLACSSPNHSLLRPSSHSSTRSGLRRYTNACHVAVLDNIYKAETDEFDITFWLPASRFARDCGYDLDVVDARLPAAFVKKGEGIRQYAQSFYNEVRSRCLANGWVERISEN